MKKIVSVILLIAAVSVNGFAQKGTKGIGVNLGYGTEIENIAIGAKFNYGITDQIRVSPSFNYFLKKNGFSAWEINADAHYLFSVAPKLNIYPLAGATFVGFSVEGFEEFEGFEGFEDDSSSSSTKFGLNLGAGASYDLSDAFSLGLELKYSIISNFNQFVPTVNLIYKF